MTKNPTNISDTKKKLLNYKLHYSAKATKFLSKIKKRDKKNHNFCQKCLKELAENPDRPNVEKMQPKDKKNYRYKKGSFRFIFKINRTGQTLFIKDVDKRKDIYKNI